MKANYDSTSNQILVFPAYNRILKNDPLSKLSESTFPHEHNGKGVDFLQMREMDSLDIAYTLNCTRHNITSKSQERVENILERKFHISKQRFLRVKWKDLEKYCFIN
jgi:hypothetical protein